MMSKGAVVQRGIFADCNFQMENISRNNSFYFCEIDICANSGEIIRDKIGKSLSVICTKGEQNVPHIIEHTHPQHQHIHTFGIAIFSTDSPNVSV